MLLALTNLTFKRFKNIKNAPKFAASITSILIFINGDKKMKQFMNIFVMALTFQVYFHN